MRLGELALAAGVDAGVSAEARITGFAIDHRKIAPGNVFGAFQGALVNGEDFIPAAVASGAIAVVARPEAKVEGALHIADALPRRLFAQLAARYFQPTPETVVAVTGTNGKTSTVEMTRQIWRMCGHRAASIGTLGVTTPDESVSTGLTTPDIVTFLGNMTGLAREGVTHVAYEASSHGLSQYRNEGLPVKAGAFTNLSRDHLDYHADMDDYFAAKMRLFTEVVAKDGAAVIWADDAWSARAIGTARDAGLRVFTVGSEGEQLRLVARTPTQLGQELLIAHGPTTAKTAAAVDRRLSGRQRAHRRRAGAGDRRRSGASFRCALAPATRARAARTRGDRAERRAGLCRLRAYARCSDSRDCCFAPTCYRATYHRVRRGRGPGPGQARADGRAAMAGSDLVIVTDDNPRGEDAAAIRAQVLAGAPGAREVGGRRDAIAAALAEAGKDDIVLIAGKGHEQGQIVGSGETMRVLPFDDVTVARECAAELAGGSGR